MALALMVMDRSQAVLIERARITVIDMMAPLLDMAARPVDTVGDAMITAEQWANLRTENLRLMQENARLLQWQSAALKLEAENQSLRDLVNLVPDPTVDYIAARAIADPGGAFVRSVIVNAGTLNGAARGQPAVSGEGLVGRVAEVGSRSARVLLITDMNSRIPVLVGAARDRAVLAGDNTQRPQLRYVGPRVEVEANAEIFTSGQGGIFPPGIPVGRVAEISDGIIRVQPLADWDHMEYLRLIDYELPGLLALPDSPKGAARGAEAPG